MHPTALDAGLRLARLCDALGHPARVVVVQYLAAQGRPCTLGELRRHLPLAQSTVSQHVAALVAAGLVHGQRRRPRTYYRLDAGVLGELKRAVAQL